MSELAWIFLCTSLIFGIGLGLLARSALCMIRRIANVERIVDMLATYEAKRHLARVLYAFEHCDDEEKETKAESNSNSNSNSDEKL